ncbi:MAG: NAD-dependent epimerase/dehydratase family protein, partial [Sphingobacteriales bacterium]
VLVTGGNGHLGNTLIKALCDKGYEVRATVRNIANVKSSEIFHGYNVEFFEADIRNEEAVKKAMHGVDGVFQVAALYNYDELSLGEGIVANNTEGSLTVLRAAKSCGINRVVMTSSIAAVGFGGTNELPMTEEDWSDPADPYCRSKVESEKAAWEFAKENGLNLITLCPSLILGPNFYKHTPSTMNVSAFINNQIPFRFEFQTSIVDVRDVAKAHILAYENENASGRYLVSGIHVPDFCDVLKKYDPDMLVPERLLSIEETKQFAEKSGAPAELIGQTFLYSDKRIKSELDWMPRPISETLVDTIHWLKEREM